MKRILKIIGVNIFVVIFLLMSAELIVRLKDDFDGLNNPYYTMDSFRRASTPLKPSNGALYPPDNFAWMLLYIRGGLE